MALVQHAEGDVLYVFVSDGDTLPSPAEALHPTELEKFTELPEARASEFLRGRYALKLLLAEKIPDSMNQLLVSADSFGKPVIRLRPDAFCSISHSGGCAAAAFSEQRPVGIDIEQIKSRHPALLRYIATERELKNAMRAYPPELLTTVLWTCKEAAAKADAHIHAIHEYEVAFGEPATVRRGSQFWNMKLFRMDAYAAALALQT